MELLPVIIGSLVALDLTGFSANLDIMLQVVVPCVISLALSEEASVVVVIVVGIEGLVKTLNEISDDNLILPVLLQGKTVVKACILQDIKLILAVP